MPSLHSLTLTGAYRLSDACVSAIASTRSSALRTLTLSGNSQLGLAAVQAIADHCVNLERLALEDMAHLRSPALLPLGILTKLTSLSFRGLMLLDGPGMLTASVGSAPLLQSLQLSGCGMIKGAEVATAAEAMPCLRDLNLDGVELLTDDDLVRIAGEQARSCFGYPLLFRNFCCFGCTPCRPVSPGHPDRLHRSCKRF
jgi:hypothetical protein